MLHSTISLLRFNVAYARRSLRLSYPPLLINLEPTNHCNLRCPMCPVSQDYQATSRGMMDMSLFDEVVRQLAKFKPHVAINLGGESTLHPELPRMIRELKRVGIYVFLDTNATRLSERLSSELIRSGLDKIVFCLDGDSAETYEEMRKGARFAETVENVRRFLRLRAEMKAQKPLTVVKNIRFYDGGAEGVPADIQALFTPHPPQEFRFTWADYWPGEHRRKLTRAYVAQPHGDDYQPCINLWKKLPISWDGMVYICCLDLDRTVPVGDLRKSSILEIWNSPAMIEARRIHRESRQSSAPLCSNCNQIRRKPLTLLDGLLTVGDDRFTPWRRNRGQTP